MKSRVIKAVVVAGVLLFLALPAFAGGGGEAAPSSETKQQYTIKLAHGVPETDPLHPTSVKFKELIEQKTNGQIKVDIYTNSQLGDEQALVQSLRSGAIELAVVYSGNAQASTPSIGATMLPYMYTTSEQAWKSLDAVTEELNKRMIREGGVRILGFYEKGFRVLTNSKKPVTRLEDLQGLKIRVTPSEIPLETFKAWGVEPIPMAWAEVFTGLQQRVIDGQENPYTTIPSSKFTEVQKYVTEIHYMMWTGPLLVSERFFQSLPDNLKAAMVAAGKESADWERQFNTTLTDDAKAAITKAGMILSGAPEDEAEWQRRAQSIWPRFYDKAGGKEWAEWVIKTVENAK
ncbi:MAG: TRAP transporter substrate-binding protein [Spirochaetales bacterium]|jgi:tripartite ATP-independent transporter DctP family solute receptor|nr:TRAP transporter substrate-binding protein [Spirochaetales bacterium]